VSPNLRILIFSTYQEMDRIFCPREVSSKREKIYVERD
jgi:hypothetical protein